MSLSLSRLLLVHASCSRLACPRLVTFQLDADSRKAAVEELRARGWYVSAVSDGKVLCPGHQDLVAES